MADPIIPPQPVAPTDGDAQQTAAGATVRVKRIAARAPDPASLREIKGPPPEPKKPPRSPWGRVYESLVPGGDGKVLTHEQAKAFAGWARGHGLRLVRRKLNGTESGVWRP